jgi:hypothetical protein
MVRRGLAALLVAGLWTVRPAAAAVWDVHTLDEFRAALANGAAAAGDVIQVHYGVYPVIPGSDPKHWFTHGGAVGNPIQIIGLTNAQGQRPVFDAAGTSIDRGIFYMWSYAPNYVIENLELCNARGTGPQLPHYSNNASAAYIQSNNVTFRNCYSHDNDDGWFSTDTADNTLLEYCETAYNGYVPDGGYTHNYYVNSNSMTVRGNYIHHSTIGQNFKSRCRHLVFESNWLEQEANYAWEIASNNVDNTLMIGNVIIKGPNAANTRIIGVSDSTPTNPASGTLTMINNTIVSTGLNQQYIYSNGVATTNLVLYNNIFAGPSTELFDWQGSGTRTGSHNWFQIGMSVPGTITNSLSGLVPGFADSRTNNFHLLPNSACRDAGNNQPQWFNRSHVWETRLPTLEYVKHAAVMARPADAWLDIGAYECLLGDLDYDGDVDLDDYTIFVAQLSGPTAPVVYEESGQLVVMEAEHTSSRSAGSGVADGWAWTDRTGGGSLGDGYEQALPDAGLTVTSPNVASSAPRLSYQVHINTGGTYYLWIKGRAVDADASTVHYGRNGVPATTSASDAALLPVGSSFAWLSQRANGFRPWYLVNPGTYSIDLWMCQDGAEIDRLLLTTDPNYVPTDLPESAHGLNVGGDLDADGDVDAADFAEFSSRF